jgi:hypothetical protein
MSAIVRVLEMRKVGDAEGEDDDDEEKDDDDEEDVEEEAVSAQVARARMPPVTFRICLFLLHTEERGGISFCWVRGYWRERERERMEMEMEMEMAL